VVNDLLVAITFLNRKDVNGLVVQWMQRYLIMNFFKYLSTSQSDEIFTAAYWVSGAGSSVDKPFDTLFLRDDLFPKTIYGKILRAFSVGDRGEGWAGAGMNPKNLTQMPQSAKGFIPGSVMSRGYEPGYGVKYVQDTNPPIPPQIIYMTEFINSLSGFLNNQYFANYIKPVYVVMKAILEQNNCIQYYSTMVNRVTQKYAMTNMYYANSDLDPDGAYNKIFIPQYNFKSITFTDSWNRFLEAYSKTTLREVQTHELKVGDLSRMVLFTDWSKWSFSSPSVSFVRNGWALDQELRDFARYIFLGQTYLVNFKTESDTSNIYRYSEGLKWALSHYKGQLSGWMSKWFTTFGEIYPALDGIGDWIQRYERTSEIIDRYPYDFGFAPSFLLSNTFQDVLREQDGVFEYTNIMDPTVYGVLMNGENVTLIRPQDLGRGSTNALLQNKISQGRKRGPVVFLVPIKLDISQVMADHDEMGHEVLVGHYDNQKVNNDLLTFTSRKDPYNVGRYYVSIVWQRDTEFVKYNFIPPNLTFSVPFNNFSFKTVEEAAGMADTMTAFSSDVSFGIDPLYMLSESVGTKE
jgi:hypothetical protein